jgi:hypothetical protein
MTAPGFPGDCQGAEETAACADAERCAETAYAEMTDGPQWPSDVRLVTEADTRGGTGPSPDFGQWLFDGRAPEAGQ